MLSLQVLVCFGLWRLGAQRAQILAMGYFFLKMDPWKVVLVL